MVMVSLLNLALQGLVHLLPLEQAQVSLLEENLRTPTLEPEPRLTADV